MLNIKNSATKFAAIALIASGVSLAAVTPSFADGGGSPIQVADGRYQPMSGDRIAIYSMQDSVDVWGLDGASNGVFLTTFTKEELLKGSATHVTKEGTVTFKTVTASTSTITFPDYNATTMTTSNLADAVYTISWKGGNYGADGSAAFSKTLTTTYSK